MVGKKLNLLFFLLVVLTGTYIRFQGLSYRPLWVDEAESCVNALTILIHGVPVDHYQGLPIYENTLVEPWPESREYEFRDSSYSRGLAVYHGWLPLYSIAASLKLFGITPQPEPAEVNVRYSQPERVRRTWVPRVPSVLFGIVGMTALYFAAYLLGGREAAWAALIAGAFAATRVQIDQQARYYAATVALSTICTLTVWQLCTRTRWRDVIACSLSLTLLFYTHLLTFADQCAVLFLFAAFQLLRRRRPGDLVKFAFTGLIVAVLTVPWLLATGFLNHRTSLPRAWPLLNIRADISRYLLQRPDRAVEVALALLLLITVWLFRRRIPDKIETLLTEFAAPAAYLTLQMLIAVALFLYLMPAASLFWDRLTLSVTAPLFLLQSLMLAVTARALSRRHAVLIASAATFLLLAINWRIHVPEPPEQIADNWRKQNQVLNFVEAQTYPEGTRLYTLSNVSLLFSYLSGLPIQSIAPVRKSFLDSYPHPIVFVNAAASSIDRGDPIDPPQLQLAAQAVGRHLDPDQARRLSLLCDIYLFKNAIELDGARLSPEAGDLPGYATEAASRQLNVVRLRDEKESQTKRDVPMFRGYDTHTRNSWWRIFAYRFVNPFSRIGSNTNYAARMSNASARIIEGTQWVYYLSPSPSPLQSSSIPSR